MLTGKKSFIFQEQQRTGLGHRTEDFVKWYVRDLDGTLYSGEAPDAIIARRRAYSVCEFTKKKQEKH